MGAIFDFLREGYEELKELVEDEPTENEQISEYLNSFDTSFNSKYNDSDSSRQIEDLKKNNALLKKQNQMLKKLLQKQQKNR